MATFTTPDRSPTTPHSAPKISGVAVNTVPASWLATGNGRSRPAAAQVRKPSTTAMPATSPATIGMRLRSRPEMKPAPANRQSTAQIATTGAPGNSMVGSCTSAKASDRANRATPDVLKNSTASSRPTTTINAPDDSRARRASRDSSTSKCSSSGASVRLGTCGSCVAVLMRRLPSARRAPCARREAAPAWPPVAAPPRTAPPAPAAPGSA